MKNAKQFVVVPKAEGRFSVENEHEVLCVLHSEEAARTACDAVNGEPGANAFDHFCGGRWSRKERAA